ncbi:hypothetical protein OPT61_g4080 [Boeremia exigua]|uniref:Uncharacterized protein n=1 Tax=Boeremia exigua TaxID=749465 RepID=A0ACC2IFH9_9PLEO|nr:hypothetical protein OPT61_g4080 [Boeremia exigua]
MFIETEPIPMTGGARDSLIAITVLWFMFAITVGLRFVGRLRGIGLGLDDILSAIALTIAASNRYEHTCVYNWYVQESLAVVLRLTEKGVGWDFDPESAVFPKLANNLPVIMLTTFAFTLIYIWCLAALKMSQLALYMRVFANQLRLWVYGAGVIVVLWAIILNFLFIFLCDPISQQWTVERVGHCMDQMLVLKCLILTNLVTDVIVVVLPIRSVWQLQMRKTEKFVVLACFGLGGACVFISLARFIQVYTIDLIGNLTGTSLTTFRFCTVELMLAGLCINLPMLRPLYIRLRAKYKSSSMNDSGEPGSHKKSDSRQLGEAAARPVNHMAWIELADKDQTMVTSDDASSERKLTTHQPDDAIHVKKDWVIPRG